MKSKREIYTYVLILTSFIFFTVLTFLSEGNYGGADSVVHYRIARYAFNYPSLFLDLWGKPLFTILSAPFAQLGYGFMKFFNVIVAEFTAILAWKILKQFGSKYSEIVIPAILFAPIYFLLIPSAMTELLFGLIITLSIYFFFKGNYSVSAIVISFLPFARNEGFIIIPLFIIAYLLKKEYKVLPFLLTGFCLFSLLGWKHFGGFFWILKNNPYTGASQIYGNGKLLHFVEKAPEIFGIPLILLFLIGTFLSTRDIIKNKFRLNQSFFFYLLVIGGSFAYFAAHSFVWWKGLGGSLGLTRVMAGIVPLFALTSGYVLDNIRLKDPLKRVFSILAILAIVYVPFSRYKVPFEIDSVEKLIKESSYWIKNEGLDKRLIYYYDPIFCHYLKLNPFDSNRVREQIGNKEKPQDAVPVGAIVIWDAHFGPNEGKMPIEKLLQNPAFKVLRHLEPAQEIKVLNGYKYEIYVFERI